MMYGRNVVNRSVNQCQDFYARQFFQKRQVFAGKTLGVINPHNWNGYNHWVNKLDNTNPDARDWKYDEMASAFIDSPEYRGRFVTPGP